MRLCEWALWDACVRNGEALDFEVLGHTRLDSAGRRDPDRSGSEKFTGEVRTSEVHPCDRGGWYGSLTVHARLFMRKLPS